MSYFAKYTSERMDSLVDENTSLQKENALLRKDARFTFTNYAHQAARTAPLSLDEDDQKLHAAIGLAEETGEVLAHVRKSIYKGRPLNRDELAEELGDVLWNLADLCRAYGLSLEAVANGNIEKLLARHPKEQK